MKAALPFMAALVPCSRHRHWETQFQAKRLGTLEMRELFLTVTAAFHAVAAVEEEEEAWMTSPSPLLPSEENWILTRRWRWRQDTILFYFFETRSGGGNGTTRGPPHRGSGCIGLFLSREVGRGTLTKANPCCGTPSIFNKMFCACCVYICRTLLSPDQQTHAEEKRDREKRGNSESFGRFLSARISWQHQRSWSKLGVIHKWRPIFG